MAAANSPLLNRHPAFQSITMRGDTPTSVPATAMRLKASNAMPAQAGQITREFIVFRGFSGSRQAPHQSKVNVGHCGEPESVRRFEASSIWIEAECVVI
jgi:hypothetical protein